MKIVRTNKEVDGVDMKCGKKYKIICNDDKTYEGEYKGYNPKYNAIDVMPGMLHILLEVSYIKSVEAVE